MTIWERFTDFYGGMADRVDYEPITIFERLIYGIFGSIAFIIAAVVLVVTIPLWAVPYLIYKSNKLKRGK